MMDLIDKSKRERNPKKNANLLSFITYFWTFPIFIKGFRKDLAEEDLYEPLSEHLSHKLGDKLEKSWKKEQALHPNPDLLRALSRIFLKKFLLCGFMLLFTEIVLKLLQPLALAKLIKYFTDSETVSKDEANMYAGAIVGTSVLHVLISHLYLFSMQHLGMKIRVACCSLIYRKALKLSYTALAETTVGQMVNLLSNDVNRFDSAMLNIHNLWVSPIQTIVIAYILNKQVGFTSTAGVLLFTLLIPVQWYLGKQSSRFRLSTALKTDERVRLMNEIICGIQVIKMYTWEKSFAKIVEKARSLEIKEIRYASYIRAVTFSFCSGVPRLAVFLSILAYVLLGNHLDARYVFVVQAYYNILRIAMTLHFPRGITQYAELKVSIARMKKFLMYDETKINKICLENEINALQFEKQARHTTTDTGLENHEKHQDNQNVIFMSDVSASWKLSSIAKTLCNISLEVGRSVFIAIIGPVGCGKTSLLQVLLQELPIKTGELKINGSISYSSQEPWIFAGTIQQNILFGKTMNVERYKQVLKVCALEKDFDLFLHGDKSLVGERGVILSGGQKARINLARAVYKEADIYLLDDPLSAVDTHVGKLLFEHCISKFLKGKCIILITHQLQYLTNINCIYLMENGIIKSSGTYQELQASGMNFAKQLGQQVNDQEDTETTIDHKEQVPKSSAQNNVQLLHKEQKSVGNVSKDVYLTYLRSGGNWCKIITVFLLFILHQFGRNSGDLFLTYWANSEQLKSKQISNITDDVNNTQNFKQSFHADNFFIIYIVITPLIISLAWIKSFVFYKFCMRASTRLHEKMFTNIVFAKMRFFTMNSTGSILNRFTKDIGLIDDYLPSTMFDTIQIGLLVLGVLIVVAAINFWMIIPTGIILIIFYVLRIIYLNTSCNVKRLEGITRSPVFALVSSSLQGLTTIRAFGVQKTLENEFDVHQDLHSSAWFLYISCARAFAFWLDFICVFYIGIVTFSFLFIGTEKYGGNVGLAITQSITLTGMFQWGVRQWSELETQMTAVERVTEYSQLGRETDNGDIRPHSAWPQRGNIEFQTVSLKYALDELNVLKQVSFAIKPTEKIGIVGRTGAGKSSIIYALFQLTETEGTILIDHVDIKRIALSKLRSQISIIPQEPVLFSGTLRKNLDPFEAYTDAALWSALEQVELKSVIDELRGGLDIKVAESGSNFSVGQRQLICLARAILCRNKILVLDEATANVDPQTDGFIQKAIRKEFDDCTVLTIAHRLHTVMDSDKVLVMDHGVVVQFDHPHLLLEKGQGVFYEMVQQTGKFAKENLKQIARENYTSRHEHAE